MYLKSTLILLFCLLLSTAGFSQFTLTAAPPSNGSGGIFLDLTTYGSDVTISKFNTYFGSTALITVEVYTRPGSYVGYTTSNSGWTFLGTATAQGAGTTTIAPMDVTALNILIPAATTQAFYLHSITSGGGIRYTGTSSAPPVQTFSDANLQLFSNVARTGTAAFAGTQNTPRTYAGSIEYFLTPLSLKWLNVSAKNQKNTAWISWEVEEDDVIIYDVEKETKDGHTVVATVNSKGNGRNSYTVSDANAFERNEATATYRVKQNDRNGQSSYSRSVVVKKTTESKSIDAHPNPFSTSLQVTVPAMQTISVEDITGKTVLSATLNEGDNTIQTQDWLPGVYFIKTDDGTKMKLLKR